MYNPAGSDSGREWIEIYNNANHTVNLEGWKFYENQVNHALGLYQGGYNLSAYGYAVIVDDVDKFLSDYPDFNATILDSSWSSLSNDGETITIKNSSLDVMNELTYTNSYGNGNNKSIEFSDDNWYEGLENMGTPGRKNSIQSENYTDICDLNIAIYTDTPIFESNDDFSFKIKIEKQGSNETNITVFREILNELDETIKSYSDLSTTINQKKTLTYSPNIDYGTYLIKTNITYSGCNDINLSNNQDEELVLIKSPVTSANVSYSPISINEFMPDPEGGDDASMPDGEWIELYNSGDEEIDVKGIILEDNNHHKLIISDTNTLSGTIIQPNDCLVVYTNGKSGFLNNDGLETIMLYHDQYLIDEVSYSYSKEALSWSRTSNGWAITTPTPENKNIGNLPENQSFFHIIKIENSGETAEFGQLLKVKVNIYKGDTSKNSIKLYAHNDDGDKISKQTKANILTKYVNFSLTLPVQLKPNCDKEFDDGAYKLSIGWTSQSEIIDSFSFDVKGVDDDFCKIDKKTTRKGSLTYRLLEHPRNIISGREFEIKLDISNNDNLVKSLDVWSYVYRGRKSYSGSRESNRKHITIKEQGSKIIELRNIADAPAGDYKLKVVVKEDDKTKKELTEDIMIIREETTSEELMIAPVLYGDVSESSSREASSEIEKVVLTGNDLNVIYESSSHKQKKIIAPLIISVLVLMLAYMFFKKEP